MGHTSPREELTSLTLDTVDLDAGAILVLGKGGRERWMPLGAVCAAALWDYLQIRKTCARDGVCALWVDDPGKAMTKAWSLLMLKRLGKKCGIDNLHPHRFRHTYAVAWLRSGAPERVLMLNAGWKKKVPETYFRTLGASDVAGSTGRCPPGTAWGKGVARSRASGPGRLGGGCK